MNANEADGHCTVEVTCANCGVSFVAVLLLKKAKHPDGLPAAASQASPARPRLRLEATQGPGQVSLIDNAPRPRDTTPNHADAIMKKPKAKKDPQYLGAQEPPAPRKKKRSKAGAANDLRS